MAVQVGELEARIAELAVQKESLQEESAHGLSQLDDVAKMVRVAHVCADTFSVSAVLL